MLLLPLIVLVYDGEFLLFLSGKKVEVSLRLFDIFKFGVFIIQVCIVIVIIEATGGCFCDIIEESDSWPCGVFPFVDILVCACHSAINVLVSFPSFPLVLIVEAVHSHADVHPDSLDVFLPLFCFFVDFVDVIVGRFDLIF